MNIQLFIHVLSWLWQIAIRGIFGYINYFLLIVIILSLAFPLAFVAVALTVNGPPEFLISLLNFFKINLQEIRHFQFNLTDILRAFNYSVLIFWGFGALFGLLFKKITKRSIIWRPWVGFLIGSILIAVVAGIIFLNINNQSLVKPENKIELQNILVGSIGIAYAAFFMRALVLALGRHLTKKLNLGLK